VLFLPQSGSHASFAGLASGLFALRIGGATHLVFIQMVEPQVLNLTLIVTIAAVA
jgi:hypothetical protein